MLQELQSDMLHHVAPHQHSLLRRMVVVPLSLLPSRSDNLKIQLQVIRKQYVMYTPSLLGVEALIE